MLYPGQCVCVRFNTQPPEGGCVWLGWITVSKAAFQHTATRRWLPPTSPASVWPTACFNTQPPEGGCFPQRSGSIGMDVSTHSHPKVAALAEKFVFFFLARFNTQPPEGGCTPWYLLDTSRALFQHTATRRWLLSRWSGLGRAAQVSTHSHPKVAAWSWHGTTVPRLFQHTATRRWLPGRTIWRCGSSGFQHTATRRWLRGCA